MTRARGALEETLGILALRDLKERQALLEIEVSPELMVSQAKRGHRESEGCPALLGLRDWTETQDATESQV